MIAGNHSEKRATIFLMSDTAEGPQPAPSHKALMLAARELLIDLERDVDTHIGAEATGEAPTAAALDGGALGAVLLIRRSRSRRQPRAPA